MNREADIDIPRRVFSAWRPSHGPWPIIRALTNVERDAVVRRRDELRAGLQPFSQDEASAEHKLIDAELSSMIGGFRSVREHGENAASLVLVLKAVLREFPGWAIVKACDLVRTNRAGVGNLWAPSDAKVHEIIADIVKVYRERRDQAEALLSAPIEQPAPEREPDPLPTPAQQAEMSKQLEEYLAKTPQQRSDENMRRVLADIEARKKARESA